MINEKSQWRKSSDELVALFEELAPSGPDIECKQMFGWPCCFLNGNLFAGLHKEDTTFRLAAAGLTAFLRLNGAAEFEPMPGRKMKRYGIWAQPLKQDPAELTLWMGRSLGFARTLPAKTAKTTTAKKRTKAKS